jgi:hypothetical protein
MHRVASVSLALLFVPDEAVGQLAWLGSEDLHRAVGGALASALDGVLPFLIAVLVLVPLAFIYGTTRLLEWGFEHNGGSPRPVTATGLALLVFSVSVGAFSAATVGAGGEGLVLGLALGFLPCMLTLVIEVVRIRRRKSPALVPVGDIEGAVTSD